MNHTNNVMDQKDEVGPGWHGILERLDVAFEYIRGVDYGPPLHVYQVKEKFGMLRVYTNKDGDLKVRAAIASAEDESGETCEICGSTDDVVIRGPRRLGFGIGWVKTLCATHHYERDTTGKIINFGI